jgi:hypothetical protein
MNGPFISKNEMKGPFMPRLSRDEPAVRTSAGPVTPARVSRAQEVAICRQMANLQRPLGS